MQFVIPIHRIRLRVAELPCLINKVFAVLDYIVEKSSYFIHIVHILFLSRN